MKPIDKNCMNCKYIYGKADAKRRVADTDCGYCRYEQLMLGHFDAISSMMPFVTVFDYCKHWEHADD